MWESIFCISHSVILYLLVPLCFGYLFLCNKPLSGLKQQLIIFYHYLSLFWVTALGWVILARPLLYFHSNGDQSRGHLNVPSLKYLTPGLGRARGCSGISFSLCDPSMWLACTFSQHGGLRAVKFPTWQLTFPRASILKIPLEAARLLMTWL